MKIVKTFDWDDGTNNDDGLVGWSPILGAEGIHPGLGFTVSHDTLEHGICEGNEHTDAHELSALGAFLFGRGSQIDLNRVHIGHDILEVVQDLHLMTDVPNGGIHIPLDEHLEEIFSKGIRQFKNLVYFELDSSFLRSILNEYRQVRKLMVPLMRKGYLAAQEAFGGCRYSMSYLFEKLSSAVDDISGEHFPGDTLTVEVDTTELTVKVSVESEMELEIVDEY